MSLSPLRFVATEPLDIPGREAERKVWDATRSAYAKYDCLAYWRYPLFSKRGEQRKEPDIVLAHPEIGLVVVEVKGVLIDQITSISGHRWTYDGYYQATGAPYQQAESQLWTLLGFCDAFSELRRRVPGRALVALPYVTREDWEAREFHKSPSAPPVLLADELGPVTLRRRIAEAAPAAVGEPLDAEAWSRFRSVLGGTPVHTEELPSAAGGRAEVVASMRARVSDLDLHQELVGKQVPPGPQQIRGIAGSGKTVLLCQKAAVMHLKHPDWDIALVFFTRSLYDEITHHVGRWVNRFSNGEQEYDPGTSRLRILHAWGAKDQPGLYGEICAAIPTKRLTVRDVPRGSPSAGLAHVCTRLLEQHDIPELFDALLIDEGQDLVVDDPLKWNGKQPIYWMAYLATKPSDNDDPDSRRLIWAYDEAQSLDSLKIPMTKELFGESRTRLTTGAYPGGIQKSEVMRQCYRTPASILVAAHALGMGLKRPGGMLSGYTRKDDWDRIGYRVKGDFTARGNAIRLTRPIEHSPNAFPSLWTEPLARFRSFASREDELAALARDVQGDIDSGLRPSHDILVITIGNNGSDRKLRHQVHQVFQESGIDTYEPTATALNVSKPRWPDTDPNRFRLDGGVTISGVHRAKGNEAASVYVVGLDAFAEDEANVTLRNHLFVAMSRSRGWISLSGIGDAPFYREVVDVLTEVSETDDDGSLSLSFWFARPSARDMGDAQHESFSTDEAKAA